MAIHIPTEQSVDTDSIVCSVAYDIGRPGRERKRSIEFKEGRKIHGNGRVIRFRYSSARAKAFIGECTDTKIGTCTVRAYHTRYGQRGYVIGEHGILGQAYVDIPADLLGALECEVWLHWGLGYGGAWQAVMMQPEDRAFVAHLRLGAGEDTVELFHCFEIKGLVNACRDSAQVAMRQSLGYGQYDMEYICHAWTHEDGQAVHRSTVYDNPYGPFSNYRFFSP
jgi:hypothetical protein